jgi:DNA polymerase/3'-5' exonuclease PolX
MSNNDIIGFLLSMKMAAKMNGNFKDEKLYERAVNSVKKYPLEIQTGKDASVLHGIGKHISKQIDEFLKNYKKIKSGETKMDDVIVTRLNSQPTTLIFFFFF